MNQDILPFREKCIKHEVFFSKSLNIHFYFIFPIRFLCEYHFYPYAPAYIFKSVDAYGNAGNSSCCNSLHIWGLEQIQIITYIGAKTYK